MIKKLMSAAVLVAVCLSVGAVESDNWKSETGATSAKKIIDFVLHDDGNIYGIAHNGKIYKRDRVARSWSEIAYSLPTTTPGGKPSVRRVLTTTWRSAVSPQLISFKSKLYTTVQYKIFYCPNDGYKHYTYPELDIVAIDPATSAVSICMQLRGGAAYSWSNHCIYPSIQTSKSTLLDGYLFKETDLEGFTGNTLYWGGGGVKPIIPIETATSLPVTFTKGAVDFKYLHSYDGTNTASMNRRAADQYGRAIPRAMPNGYRYSQLIDFKGVLWDYYGYYTPGSNDFDTVVKPAAAGSKCTEFSFTPKLTGTVPGLAGTRKVLTEPWSRFQMGVGDINGTERLFRVGFAPKGDKNFICSITGTGGSWADYNNSNGGAAWDGPDHAGLVYWRGCAVVKNQEDAATAMPYSEILHNGLYATYSKKNGAAYESGVFRYAEIDTDGDGLPDGGWKWSKVRSTADATSYTGAIFVQNNDPGDADKGVIVVGTKDGVRTRGIGRYDDNATPADKTDDKNVMPE